MSRIKKQLEICPPAYMCKGSNRENFVSTGHKCGYCKGNGWFWGTEYLCENYHPHVTAIVTPTSVEVMEGIQVIPNITEFIVD